MASRCAKDYSKAIMALSLHTVKPVQVKPTLSLDNNMKRIMDWYTGALKKSWIIKKTVKLMSR